MLKFKLIPLYFFFFFITAAAQAAAPEYVYVEQSTGKIYTSCTKAAEHQGRGGSTEEAKFFSKLKNLARQNPGTLYTGYFFNNSDYVTRQTVRYNKKSGEYTDIEKYEYDAGGKPQCDNKKSYKIRI